MSQPQRELHHLAAENAALRQRVAELEAALTNSDKHAVLASPPASIHDTLPFLLAVLEQLPIGVAIAEAPSGRLLTHNAEAVRLLRHPLLVSDDYTGYSQYGAFHPDDRPYQPAEYPLARALLHTEAVPFEDMTYRRGDGTLTMLAVNAAPIYDAQHQMIAAVSTFFDVAEQRQLEAELRHEPTAKARGLVSG